MVLITQGYDEGYVFLVVFILLTNQVVICFVQHDVSQTIGS